MVCRYRRDATTYNVSYESSKELFEAGLNYAVIIKLKRNGVSTLKSLRTLSEKKSFILKKLFGFVINKKIKEVLCH